MKPLRSAAIALYAVFLLWLYGGDLVRWVRLQTAPVAVMNDAPWLLLGVLGTAIALALLAALFTRVTSKPLLPPRFTKWVPVLAVLLPLVDFVAISSRNSFVHPEEMLVGAANTVAEAAAENSGNDVVAREPAMLEAAVAPYSDVPVFVKGERVSKWNVQLREGCSGPATDVRDATPGTIVYCVSGDRRRAWVNVVATAAGTTFGDVAVSGLEAPWVALVEIEDRRENSAPTPVWQAPTPE